IVATEVMVTTAAISNMIRKGNIQEIKGVMETGLRMGMHTLDQSLEDLYSNGLVTRESVLAYTSNVTKFI
ncbi:MAG: type IV pili twitching motility protein PilT, partial [Candidatus Omnitrophica bacterium]|nr:type IV pili twitching motility protein PilT [Candidatus Omnitrophota bacterium]